MTSLVAELQQVCIASSAQLSDILRMALLVSNKLDLSYATGWIEKELNGYENSQETPSYRVIQSQIKAFNPARGMIPVIFENPQEQSLFDEVRIVDSANTLERLIASTSDGSKNRITIPFLPEQEAFLMQGQYSQSIRPIRTVGSSQLSAIMDTVKNRVLQWSFELDKSGITGEGMTFSKDEKSKAAQNVNITTIHGSVQGNVGQSGGTANQTYSMTVEAGNFESLANYLKNNDVSAPDIQDLEQAIVADGDMVEPKKLGSKVSEWMGNMTAKAASGAWGVGIGAAANILGSAITKFYNG